MSRSSTGSPEEIVYPKHSHMLVHYYEAADGKREVHERVLIRHLARGWYHVLTPDGDVYAEQLSCPPAVKIWGPLTTRPTGGRYWPRGLGKHELYRLEDGGAELFPPIHIEDPEKRRAGE